MPKTRDRATAAVVKALAMRRKEKVNRWRDSIRAQRLGMKFAPASGAAQASRYARKRTSSSWSSLSCMEFIIALLHIPLLPRYPCTTPVSLYYPGIPVLPRYPCTTPVSLYYPGIPVLHRYPCTAPVLSGSLFFRRSERFQDSLPGAKQSHLKSILVNFIDLFKLF